MRHSLLPLTALLLATACGRGAAPAPELHGAWIRLPAVAGRPGAAYFVLRSDGAPVSIVRVTTPVAGRSELHETMGAGGMMTMSPLAAVDVAAGSSMTFAPGGKHVMLFEVDPRARPGRSTTLTVTLADGRSLAADARLVAAGDPAPSGE